MSSLHEVVADNFAHAARGKRSTFAAAGRSGARLVLRALLDAASHDVFIFSRGLPLEIYSPILFRHIVSRGSTPRIRILIDASEEVDNSALFEMSDLIAP